MSAVGQPVTAARVGRERQPSGWDHLKALLPYIVRYKGMSALGMLALTLTAIVGVLPQLLQGALTDSITGAPVPLKTLEGLPRAVLKPFLSFYAPHSRHVLALYCLIIIAVMLVKGFLYFWTRWVLIGISREIEFDLRNDLLDRLLKLDPEFYVRNPTGDLMSRATNDLNNVRAVLGPGIMYSGNTIAMMVLALFFMFSLAPALTFWVLLPVPVVALSVRHFGQAIHRLTERIQAALGALSTRAQENLSGVRVIRAYAQEKAEIETFDQANREYVNRNIKLISTWSLFFPALTALIGVTVVLLFSRGGTLVIRHTISIGTFWTFSLFLGQLTWPMIALGWVTNIFQRGAASMGRLNYILHAEPNIRDGSGATHAEASDNGRPQARVPEQAARAPLAIRGEVEYRHLTFSYPTASGGAAGEPVLRDVDLKIPAGSTVAVVGPTGSGKSTLVALLARLWEAPPGSLLIDGRSIRNYPLDQLRQAIGYVPQDTFLFSETVRENIAVGAGDALEEQLFEAAEIASLSGEIQGFPQRFETLIGERGITLSGGQKQRTALARAILRQPRILILDDAFSSVDTDTEERILGRLRGVMRQRTTILVSHRVSTVQHADQIVVLREGRIIERGTHDELLALGGYYADLHLKQLLEEELERE